MQQTGSIKNKVVAPVLTEERAKCDFDQEELRVLLMGGPTAYAAYRGNFEKFGNNPKLANHITWYEMTPEEKQEDLWRRNNVFYNEYGKEYIKDYEALEYPYNNWHIYFQGLLPGFGLHTSMYWLSIENLANEE